MSDRAQPRPPQPNPTQPSPPKSDPTGPRQPNSDPTEPSPPNSDPTEPRPTQSDPTQSKQDDIDEEAQLQKQAQQAAQQERQAQQEKANHALICRLLLDVAPVAMRQVFSGIHPATNLTRSLSSPQTQVMLRRLHRHKVLDDQQWALLFPPNKPTSPASSYDAILLMILLKTVCHLSPPYPGGWSTMPIPADRSLGADLVRIAHLRTDLASSVEQSLSARRFTDHHKQVSDVMERLGGNQCRIKVDRLSREPLDQHAAERYVRAVEEWDERARQVEATEARVGALLRKRANDSEMASLSASLPDGSEALTDGQRKGSKSRSKSRSLSRHSKLADTSSMKPEDLRQHQRNVIMAFYKPLTEQVKADEVLPKLIQRGVLSHEEKNHISLATRNTERMVALLDILITKTKAFDTFCDVIKYKYTSLQEQLVKAKQAPFSHEKPDGLSVVASVLMTHYSESLHHCHPLPWHPNLSRPLTDFTLPWSLSDLHRPSVALEDIFSPHAKCSRPRQVMIHGESGSGKSLLAANLTYLWSKRSLNNTPTFKLVFSVNVGQAHTDLIGTLLDQCLPDSLDIHPAELNQVISDNQQNVLFIIDGYENIHDLDSELYDLLHKRLYPRSYKVLLINSHFVSPVVSKLCDTKLVLQGLEVGQQADLIRQYAEMTNSPEDDFINLIQLLRQDVTLPGNLLALNPLYCLAMCLITEMKLGVHVATETELLHTFITALKTLFCRRNLLQVSEGAMPEELETMMRCMEALAHHMITTPQQAVPTQQLVDQFKEKMESWFNVQAKDLFSLGLLGLIREVHETEVVDKCHFTQRVILEYLAASHLCQVSGDHLSNHLTYLSNHHLSPVLRFYCGIRLHQGNMRATVGVFEWFAEANATRWQAQPSPTSRPSTTSTINSSHFDEPIKTRIEGHMTDLHLMLDCLEEGQSHPNILNIVMTSTPEKIFMKNRALTSLGSIRGLSKLVEANSPRLVELDLRLDHFSQYHTEAYLQLANAIARNPHILSLKLRWTDAQFMAQFLSNVFSHHNNMQSLEIKDMSKSSGNKISATLWSDLRAAGSGMSNVTSLSFTECQNTAIVTCVMSHAPGTMETLRLSGCRLDMLAAQKLTSMVEKSHTLHDLDLSNIKMNRAEFVNVMLGIRLNRSLLMLRLSAMELDNAMTAALCESLQFNNSIQHLVLSKNTLSDWSCKLLGSILASNKSLATVQLHDCVISEDGVYIMKHLKRAGVALTGLHRRRTLTVTSLFHANCSVSLPAIPSLQADLSVILEEA